MDNGANAAKEPKTTAIHNRLEREIVPGLSIVLSKELPNIDSFPSYLFTQLLLLYIK
jgi:hypothetical protein